MRVGVIGLGIMGSAISANLLEAGHSVVGYDLKPSARTSLTDLGGRAVSTAAAVATEADMILTSLPSAQPLMDVSEEIATLAPAGTIVVETSTLDLATKRCAQGVLREGGIELLDCPLSGTGAQARVRDVAVYGSGDEAAFEEVRSVLEGFSRSVLYVGAFGSGSIMKYVANLLVAAHNVCTAEAFALGIRAGLDRRTLWEVIADGAGGSVIFTHRGKLMIDDAYLPATAKISMFVKDVDLVRAFAQSLDLPTPMLDATVGLYDRAMGFGFGDQDAAALLRFMQTDRIAAAEGVTAPLDET
ncbi:2-hydroxy-3-oxopropionate reductase [Acidothermaceae bacterium B102]|nr:2-hydroxy-3-oxopropionate reductase [Acidothermaceae bacterium B102]